MGENSRVEWTDHTFCPWHGCAKVSPGCANCFAEAFSKRIGYGKRLPTIWGPSASRRFFGDKHWRGPLAWNREWELDGIRRKVFVASMSDVFEDREDLVDHRARLFRLIEACTHLDWLLLTKRPENVQRLAAECTWLNTWPENVALGTSAEDQEHANKRIPELLDVRGPAFHFVSCEPLLEPVDLSPWMPDPGLRTRSTGVFRSAPALAWVIVGGESGARRRPFEVAWGRSLVEQAHRARVAVFVKQDSAATPGQQGRIPDDLWIKEFPAWARAGS